MPELRRDRSLVQVNRDGWDGRSRQSVALISVTSCPMRSSLFASNASSAIHAFAT